MDDKIKIILNAFVEDKKYSQGSLLKSRSKQMQFSLASCEIKNWSFGSCT